MSSIIVRATEILTCDYVLAAGLRATMGRRNERASSSSGKITVNVLQDTTLRSYGFSVKGLTRATVLKLIGLYETSDAGAYGFLMEDPVDSTADVGDGLLRPYLSGDYIGSAGLGFGVPVLRLLKRYTGLSGTYTKDRRIEYPKASPVLKRAASTVTYGVAAGNASIDLTTGEVTFVADASNVIFTINPGSTTVLNFSTGTGIVAATSVGERVYVSGQGGAVGAVLNNKSHVVAAKGATSITLSVVTPGSPVGGGGVAARYPQASEAMTWTGDFYVPVHFAGDDFEWQLGRPGPTDDLRLWIGSNVALDEVPE